MKTRTMFVAILAASFLWVMGVAAQADSPVVDGLIRHYDAGAIQGLSDGETMSTWTDLSGNQDATAYNEPTWRSDSINGLPAVTFDGLFSDINNEYFQIGDLSTLTAGQAFIVFKRTEKGASDWNYSGLWRFGTSQASHVPAPGNPPSIIYDCFGSSARKNSIAIAGDPLWTTGLIYSASSAPGAWRNVLNGVELFTTTDNSVAFESNALLGTSALGTATTLSGDIAELLLYNRVLSRSEEEEVGYYLGQKYNITNNYTSPYVKATNPVPQDAAEQVEPDVELSWDAPLGVANPTYKVYLNMEPDLAGITPIAVTQTRYSPEGGLEYAMDYYWRVDVIEPAGPEYTGDIWSFTTYVPECDPLLAGDVTGDCIVDIEDLMQLWDSWLECNLVPQLPDAYLWPTYRHDGQLTGFSPLRGGLENPPRVVWSVDLGGDMTANAEDWHIDDFNGDNRYELVRVQSDGILCQNLETGAVLWQATNIPNAAVVDIRDYAGDGTRGIFLKSDSITQEDYYMVCGATGTKTLLCSIDNVFWYRYRFGHILPGVAGQQLCLFWDRLPDEYGNWHDHGFLWSFESGVSNPTVQFQSEEAGNVYGAQHFFADMDNDGRAELVLVAAEQIWIYDLDTNQLESHMGWSPSIRTYWTTVGAMPLSPGQLPALLMINQHVPGVQVVTQDANIATRLWKQVIGPIESQYQSEIVVRAGAPDPFMDIDNDGTIEMMVLVSNEHGDGLTNLVIFNANNGQRLFDQTGITVLSADDLDGDTIPEILLRENGTFKITNWNGSQFVSRWQSTNVAPLLVPAPEQGNLARTAGMNWPNYPYNCMVWRETEGQPPFLFQFDGTTWACTLDAQGLNQLHIVMVHEALGNIPDPDPPRDSYAWQGNYLIYYIDGVEVSRYEMPQQKEYMPPPAIVGKLGGEIRAIARDYSGSLQSFSTSGDDRQTLLHSSPAYPDAWYYYQSDASVCDVDGDGENELLATTSYGGPSVVIVDEDGRIEQRIDPVPNCTEVALGPNGSLGQGQGRWFVVRYRRNLQTEIVVAYDGRTGQQIWSRDWYGTEKFVLHIPSAVYDYDDDGAEDMLTASENQYGIISASDNRDLVPASKLTDNIPGQWPAYSTPIVCNIDSQGSPEVLFSRAHSVVFLSDLLGNPLWHYALTSDTTPETHTGLADLDGDGIVDVVIAQPDGLLRAFTGSTGQQRWTYQLPGPITGQQKNRGSEQDFAAADLDNDGKVELLVGAGDGKLYALKEVSGECVVLWSVDLGRRVGSPILADIDFDGRPEILVPAEDGHLYCLDSP